MIVGGEFVLPGISELKTFRGRQVLTGSTVHSLHRMSQPQEKLAGLALIPVVFTILYYFLPQEFQRILWVQFLPQISAYACLGVWAYRNDNVVMRLGLGLEGKCLACRWGVGVGLVLGVLNTFVILWMVPALGGEIFFLKDIPHAKVPTLVMVPWFIMAIAIAVELNFRGFLLGRLLVLVNQLGPGTAGLMAKAQAAMAIGGSALVFSFDPFMVSTFQRLHWIAVWDGMIWGVMWVRWRNLYAVIVAHAIEVVILYLWVKNALT